MKLNSRISLRMKRLCAVTFDTETGRHAVVEDEVISVE